MKLKTLVMDIVFYGKRLFISICNEVKTRGNSNAALQNDTENAMDGVR